MNLEDEMEPKYASSRGRFWACILSAAACTGLGAWGVGETTLNFFKPTAQEISSGVVAYTPTDNTSYLRETARGN